MAHGGGQVAALITVAAKFSHAIERIKHWQALDHAAAAAAAARP